MDPEDFPEDLIVTITDVRKRHCVSGARDWCNMQGIDFRDFIRNGIPARRLAETGDALVHSVLQDVLERYNGR